MAYGNSDVGEFIELVNRLPLGGSCFSYSNDPDQLLYEDFLISAYCMYDEGARAFCEELRRDRKLVVLLACIWAKAQVGEMDEPNVVKGAQEALRLLGGEAITANTLTALLRDNRESIQHSEYFPEYIDARVYNARDFAVAAERLLCYLVG